MSTWGESIERDPEGVGPTVLGAFVEYAPGQWVRAGAVQTVAPAAADGIPGGGHRVVMDTSAADTEGQLLYSRYAEMDLLRALNRALANEHTPRSSTE